MPPYLVAGTAATGDFNGFFARCGHMTGSEPTPAVINGPSSGRVTRCGRVFSTIVANDGQLRDADSLEKERAKAWPWLSRVRTQATRCRVRPMINTRPN